MQKRTIICLTLASLVFSACNIGVPAPQDPNVLSTAAAWTVQALLTPAATQTQIASPIPGVAIDGTTAEPTTQPCKDSAAYTAWTRDNANYDVNLVNAPLAPNASFEMSWTIQNTGDCIWNSNYQMHNDSGTPLTKASYFPIMPTGNVVNPNESITVAITMTAPAKAGEYKTGFSLQSDSGKDIINFGVITKVGSSNSGSGTLAAPGNLRYEYSCVPGAVTFTLFWVDKSNDENGFRIYRDGSLIGETAAGATTYSDIVPSVGSYEYTVAAFNASGEAPARVNAAATNCQ